jgi:IS5 family transposase
VIPYENLVNWLYHEVTSASVHDSEVYEYLVQEAKKGEAVFGDSAYSSEELKKITREQQSEPLFCMKGKKNKSLNKVEQEWNRQVSKFT